MLEMSMEELAEEESAALAFAGIRKPPLTCLKTHISKGFLFTTEH